MRLPILCLALCQLSITDSTICNQVGLFERIMPLPELTPVWYTFSSNNTIIFPMGQTLFEENLEYRKLEDARDSAAAFLNRITFKRKICFDVSSGRC